MASAMALVATIWIAWNLSLARPVSWKLFLLPLCAPIWKVSGAQDPSIENPGHRVDKVTSAENTSATHALSVGMRGGWTYLRVFRTRGFALLGAYIKYSANQERNCRSADTQLDTCWNSVHLKGDVKHWPVRGSAEGTVDTLIVRPDVTLQDAHTTSISNQRLRWTSPFNITTCDNTDEYCQFAATAPAYKAHVVVRDERDRGSVFRQPFVLLTALDNGQRPKRVRVFAREQKRERAARRRGDAGQVRR